MPTFTYKSRVRGKVKTGEVEAEDEKAAVSKLKLQNIRVTTIKKKAGESALFGPKVHKITTRDVVILPVSFRPWSMLGSLWSSAWIFLENSLTIQPLGKQF